MTQQVLTVTVPAGPPAVFRYLTEPELLTRWIDGLRESRPLGDRVMRVGARSIEVVEAQGRTMEIVSEVTALDPDRMLAVRITYPGAGDTDMVYELAPVASGTELRLTVTPRYRGVARLVGRLMQPMMRRRLQGNLDRLARVV
ncbi:SRPBCC family protein [Paractinoplanes rishiriensis]|uniref:Polyketide cyclase n=1 Tax=Paractinoplanes rishiriensis TaxID=1050105 RepID=A0A919MYU2_9ACTN|nr:SRPBCC family protein [Actinoplanes rishiriensis]GIE92947.1 hypothetical protein Ari01nite_04120 [Actinoplanes rishiriensis]